MEFKNLLKAQNRDELRQWLTENHSKESECWGIVKRGRPIDSETFWYIDAVEEAESVLDIEGLVAEAVANIERVRFDP